MYRNHLMQKLTRHKSLRADASINRELATLRHAFSKAVEWDMMERNPFEKGKSLMLKLSNQRTRYLTEEEIPKLLGECKTKKHLHHIVVCALNTGMRRGEILNLNGTRFGIASFTLRRPRRKPEGRFLSTMNSLRCLRKSEMNRVDIRICLHIC